ncbi:DUF4296 domain-containing protein [Polaribacter batillariae]|uniref:DUF4296 domain-containing protein n=1 Tax=Polaribacter batillariae TaxID=2808900 RepID=A0ABX7SU93_9FLAO|nr:DUF4296 domain-containing protein [Polaribacter batillariae]QTD36541.1 DUF4296 domain-containing protein [Polaribacter batillariae]
MKKISALFILIFLVSCTSNTIFEKPKDLIPQDTMSLLLQEMMIASSAKFIKNTNNEKNINYMSLVYDKFKIDSSRFMESNFYYMSKIDLYQKMLENAKKNLETKTAFFKKQKAALDSIRKDSLGTAIKKQMAIDSLKVSKDSLLKIESQILEHIQEIDEQRRNIQ